MKFTAPTMLSLLALALASGTAVEGAEPKLSYEVTARSTTIDLHGRVWLDATLTNEGDSTVVVFWGDRAYCKMHVHEVKGPRGEVLPTSQRSYRDLPLPTAARQRYFRSIAPGKSLKYAMVLGSLIGANTQWVSFSEPGQYTIEPSFHVITDHVMDPNVDDLVAVPDVWTGSLFAPAIKFRVSNRIDRHAVAIAGATTITGQVVDPQGKPLAGARVQSEIRIQGGSYDGWARIAGPSGATNKQGEFTLRRINHGSPDYKLTVIHPKYSIQEKVLVNSGEKKLQAKIQMERGIELRGLIQMPSGIAMRGVTVSGAQGQIAHTNEQGEFTIKSAALSDEYSVTCSRPGFHSIYPKADRAKATNGSWTIEMQRESNLHGIALLPNGTPLKRARIEFRFRPAGKPDATARGDRTQADENGRFQITLPSAGPHDITALAEDGTVERHLPHDAWETLVENVGPTKEEIVFEFDNSAALKVTVAPTVALPPTVQLRATVFRKQLDNHRLPFRKRVFPANGGSEIWRNISPGEYQIEVHVENSTRYNWQQTVDVPPGGIPREVVFDLPKLEFGQLHGRVFLPDGKPGPVSLWYDSSRGHGSIRADDEGRFHLPLVSAGRLWVSSRDEKLIGRVETIVPDGGVGLIELRLKDRDQVTGIVQGTAKLPDGTPLAGATTEEFVFGFRGPAVEPGTFEERLPLGENYLMVHLSRSATWQKTTGRVASDAPRHFRTPQHESITSKVKVGRGVNRHDITLPTDFVNLLVHLKNRDHRQPWSLEVSSDLAAEPGAFRYRRRHRSSGVYDEQPTQADLDATKKVEFIGIPRGKTFLIARQEGTMLWKKVPKGQTEVTLDPSQTGRINFALMDERGQALKNGALRIEAVELPDARFIWAPEHNQADKRPRRDKWAMINAQGITLFSPVSAGAYRIYATEGLSEDKWNWNEPKKVQVRVGETLEVRALLKNGKITWRD